MRVLWYGVPPWLPTGYAGQAAIWCQALQAAGHDVAIQAHAGLHGEDREWNGIPVFAAPMEVLAGPLILQARLQAWKPDVVFVLCDHRHILQPELFAQYRTVAFIAADCHSGLSAGDADFLQRSRAYPWAMSRHVQRLLEDAGYDAPYVPHAIDTSVWAPPEDRAVVRAAMGLKPSTFAVLIVARNIDPQRKALGEQIFAFSRFRQRHPDSRLFLHSINAEWSQSTTPTVLSEVASSLGLKNEAVSISYQVPMYLEQFPQAELARLYGGADVVMNATRGEGFGLAAVEAQACGTPVILADNTTGPELAGPGWLAECDPDHWAPAHRQWQAKPLHKSLVSCLVKAWVGHGVAERRAEARRFALQFGVGEVWPLFEKALEELVSE